MKAMSKFFLIISGILAAVGIILLIIGSLLAKSKGIQLFQKKTDGKYLYTLDLTDKDITKISVDATDADITISTGEEKEYIEFINFNENYYSIATTNKVIKFEEHVDISNLISFWDGNFTFKGMRSFFNLGNGPTGQKEVIIHLSDTSDINVFSFTIESGDITVQNAASNTDYTFTLDSGDINMINVSTDSKVMINGNNCSVNFESCAFKYFTSDIATVNMNADIKNIHSFEFTGMNGSVNVKLTTDIDPCDVRIASDTPFVYNSENYNGTYSSFEKSKDLPDEYSVVHITGNNISINAEVTNNVD